MSSITELPVEILLEVFRYLEPPQLVRCRRVCARWQEVVDLLVDEKSFWQRLCQRRHPSTYLQALNKCDPTLKCHELYKSLHLWSKLDRVDEEKWKPIFSYSEKDIGLSREGVKMVSARHGSISVHIKNKILYYDLKGEMTGEFDTEGEQLGFKETEHIIVFVVLRLSLMHVNELTIIKKRNGKPDLDSKIVIDDVINCAVVGEDVYHDKLFDYYRSGQIFVCRAKDNYKSTLIGEMDSEIIALGSANDTLNIYLLTNDVYTYLPENNKFVKQQNVRFKTALYLVKTYNFLEFPNNRILEDYVSDEVGYKVSVVYFYGDLTFLGGHDGILRLYNTKELLARPATKPLRQFNVSTRLETRRIFCSKITGIDVIEKKNGHIILVSILKGAITIELTHTTAGIKKRKLEYETCNEYDKRRKYGG